jgi:hypothetical protein
LGSAYLTSANLEIPSKFRKRGAFLDAEMQPLEEQCGFFTLFHDGGFTPFQRKGNDIEFQVDIAYLAEIIDPTYTYFSTTLKNCRYCAFESWDDKKVRDEDVNAINTYIEDMEILSANCENNQMHVMCHGHRKSIGGYFIFLCDSMVVLDEGGKEVTFDELKGIARRYWEGFAQKNTEGIS